MKRFFNPESGIWRLLGMLGDLLLLSMLWVVCSAPILTLGAATAALYESVVSDFFRHETDYLTRFFRTFRRELKSALLPTLLWLLVLGGLFWGYDRLAAAAAGSLGLMLKAGLFLLLLLPIGAACWVFPMLSRFTLDFGTLNLNALRLAIGRLPRTLLIAAASCAAALVTLRFALLPLFVLPALLALLWAWLMEPVFRSYEK